MAAATFALIPVVGVRDGVAPLPAGPGWEPEPTMGSAVAAARAWYGQGARRIEFVDLQALEQPGTNTNALAVALRTLHNRAHTDLVCGAHDDSTLQAALRLNPTRVVLSTAAVADLDFVRRAVGSHRGRISVRLVIGDGGRLHAPGTAAEGLDVYEVLASLQSIDVPHYQVCDATRHEHWWQAHHDVLKEFCQVAGAPVTAGSGVDNLEHLHALCELVPLGLDGAVIDHALSTGVFTFADAVAAVAARYDPYEWGPAQP